MNQVGNLNRGIPTSFEQSSAETKNLIFEADETCNFTVIVTQRFMC